MVGKLFLCKGPDRILGFTGLMQSATGIQLCSCSAKVAKDNTLTNECSCVLIKQMMGWIWPTDCRYQALPKEILNKSPCSLPVGQDEKEFPKSEETISRDS